MSRYLWAVGEHTAAYQTGDILADRYLCKGPRIFLDTKPASLPANLDEVPEPFIPYLKLSPNQLHIPQIYDWIQSGSSNTPPLLLLDQAPLYVPRSLAERGIAAAASSDIQILPTLFESWQAAFPLRQLHWLWQIANLWHSMHTEGVASSLLTPELLRIEGPIIRLLELHADSPGSTSLRSLGEFWSELAQTARPEIQAPLHQLCQEMSRGAIRNAEEVVNHLDGSIADLGRSQQSRQIQIATLSDQGPSRQRNEDACYPASGTVTKSPPGAPLLIVCDGIGGHQGGDVASNLAIKALEQRLKALQPDRLNAVTLEVELEKAVGAANDLISQQNDSEQRFDRQRMGTTVVMGLLRAHELYITHVGDSRAYWITRWGCHQITQDDDVASREVRLGYSSYPQALQQPSAGSLVQALGMGNATNLYPTVQRFILDEDCVFLLCSDGLSDNDQVENHWEKVILPLLDGRTDLSSVSQQWVNIANSYNGYDNATVGLIHCKISGTFSATAQTVSQTTTSVELPPTLPPRGTTLLSSEATTDEKASNSDNVSISSTLIPTQRLEAPKRGRQPSLFSLLAQILALTGMATVIVAAVFGIPNLNPSNNSQSDSSNPSSQPDQPSPQISAPISEEPNSNNEQLVESNYFQVNVSDISVELSPQSSNQGTSIYRISRGSIVHKSNEERDPTQSSGREQTWIELMVCPQGSDNLQSLSSDELNGNSPTPGAIVPSTEAENLKPGQRGWITSRFYEVLLDNGTLQEVSDEELNALGIEPSTCLSSSTVKEKSILLEPSSQQIPSSDSSPQPSKPVGP